MTSSHHAPYVQGYTRATLARTEGCDTARWSESLKARLGSDCRLKPACMKAELLVIADQHCRDRPSMSTGPGSVYGTYRPVRGCMLLSFERPAGETRRAPPSGP